MDDLPARLDRLAPHVAARDTDGALAGVHAAIRRRQVTRRRLSIAAALLVVLVLASGIALARQSDDGADRGAVLTADGGPSSSVGRGSSIPRAGSTVPDTEPTVVSEPGSTQPGESAPTAVPPPTSPTPTTAPGSIADPAEIEVRVTLDNGPLAVGTRARFTVEIVNHSAAEAAFTSNACLAGVVIEGMPGYDARPAPWTGPPTSLRSHVAAGGNDLVNQWGGAVPPNMAGGKMVCTLELRIERLAAGATSTRHYVWDAAVVPGATDLPTGVRASSSIEVLGPFGLGQPTTRVEGRAPVVFADDERAHRSADTFLQNVDSSPVLLDFLGRGGLASSGFRSSLGYVNGRFELWFDMGATRVRVLGDTTTGAVTEIRVLDSVNSPPSDDPDGTPSGSETVLTPA